MSDPKETVKRALAAYNRHRILRSFPAKEDTTRDGDIRWVDWWPNRKLPERACPQSNSRPRAAQGPP